jgi:hypothetical protein
MATAAPSGINDLQKSGAATLRRKKFYRQNGITATIRHCDGLL